MARQGQILIVDDLEQWREIPAKSLRRAGFLVDTIDNVNDALQLLHEKIYHVLVLDIRMQERDNENIEGMQLLDKLSQLQIGVGSEVQIIMLSAHGTKEQMRTAFARHQVADFASKDEFDNLEFVEQVRQLFVDKIRINLQLDIHWQPGVNPQDVVVDKRVNGLYIKEKTTFQQQIAAELDDLLSRLFYKANSIAVKPLMPGRSGAGVLWVEPFYDSGAGEPVVVKFGDVRDIYEEYRRFNEYVEPFIGGGRTTKMQQPRRTRHLGGIAYTFISKENEKLRSFGDFYRQADHLSIQQVFDHLFEETCAKWYASPGQLTLCKLNQYYQDILKFTHEGLLNALNDKKFRTDVKSDQTVTFKALGYEQEFTNPVLAAHNVQLERTTYLCNTHGDFNESNILIDEAGRTWLIDFLRSGPGHILRDVAELDITIRIRLLDANRVSLRERLEMERVLCSIQQYSQLDQLDAAFPTENKELATAYATVVHLRKIARRLVSSNPQADMNEYYIALFYYSLHLIRLFGVPIMHRQHAFLSASLLADRIGLRATA